MPTISFALSGVTGGPNGTRSFTISDADVARWINAYRAAAQRDEDKRDDAAGAERAPVTDAQVLAYWAREVMRQTRQQTRDHETATPADITVTEN